MADEDWSPPDSDFQTSAPEWAPPETDFGGSSTVKKRPTMVDPETSLEVEEPEHPVQDVLHQALSGTGHAVIGGLKGLVAGANATGGKKMDAAADAVNAETSKSYQAPASVAKTIAESKYNPVNYLQNAADSIADTGAGTDHIIDPETSIDLGPSKPVWPSLSAAMKAAPTAIGAITGLRSMKSSKPSVAATESAPMSAADVVGNAATEQSMGAAGAPAVDVTKLTPETQQAIVDAGRGGNSINQDAVVRHHDAETLPMPEGETALRLRKGQASGDAQQISDEINMRADPDTNKILEQSINDQDRKLGGSLTEIRRQATPDVVQRTNREHGQAAIDAIKAQDNASVLDIRSKYKALEDANGGNIPIDAGQVVNNTDDIFARKFLTDAANKNTDISSIMNHLRQGKPFDVEGFEAARTNLADVAKNGSGSEKTAASILRSQLENLPLPPEANKLKGLADDARAAAKTRFDTIDNNPAYEAAVNDGGPKKKGLHIIGPDSPIADSFMDRYALGNGQNASRAYVARLKAAVPDPELSKALEAASLNKLSDAAGLDKFGNGNFKNATYRNTRNAMADKADVLMSPESLANTEQLKRVSGYVNDTPKSSSVNRSNTALTLQRFGAQAERDASPMRELANHGADVAIAHTVGPVGNVAKSIGQSLFKKSQDAKAAKALSAAKLKFALDATAPGAGIAADGKRIRPARASGGKVGHDELVERLIKRWKAAKRDTDDSTKRLLDVPDAAIVKALSVAQESI